MFSLLHIASTSRIFRNPTLNQIRGQLKNSSIGEVRYRLNNSGDLYIGNSTGFTHGDLADGSSNRANSYLGFISEEDVPEIISMGVKDWILSRHKKAGKSYIYSYREEALSKDEVI